MSSPSAIRVRSLEKAYDDLMLFDHLSLDVAEDEFVTIFGPNGCGKSTLLRILAGLDSAFKGEVEVFGRRPGEVQLGFIFQQVQASLFPWLTCSQNVAFASIMKGTSRQEVERIGRKHLESVGLTEWEKAYPYQLSGGMMQRLAIARVLASEPRGFLMDEPFSSLDYFGSKQMENLLMHLWEEQQSRTTVFVSHRLDEAILLADRLLVFSHRPTRIIQEFKVALPRPRNHTHLLNPEFERIRTSILKTLLDEKISHV